MFFFVYSFECLSSSVLHDMGIAPRSDPRRGLGLLAQGKPSNERQRRLRGVALGFEQKKRAPEAGRGTRHFAQLNVALFLQTHLIIFNLVSIKKFNMPLSEIHLVIDVSISLNVFAPRPTSGAHYFFAQTQVRVSSNIAASRLRAYPRAMTPTLFEGRFAASTPIS